MVVCKKCDSPIPPDHALASERGVCRPCNSAAQRAYNAKNRERLNAKRREDRRNRGQEHRDYENAYRAENAARINERERANRYGLTVEELRALVDGHDGTCAICGGTDPHDPRWGQWAIDHDHDTGRVRGILCGRCNKGIGLLRDDPDLIARAVEYLRSHATA